ncbi:Glycosyl transferase family 2 [Sphingomonas gellani]|uniref:Glycosyl transferase family 2 n=1 Tax=Sphingomonas gellani TaxID=1166340 RepID=A0A1H8HW44_9SPHN|nr:glycosyltransferase family A protein [Sphingomonas gellani]SEN60413.1 Glycosyl transferase family 2 [Sphingomonas gellani]
MTFSVVIPLYNKAPHIERAIASALGQTLPPHEVIVVDDGSTDGGLEIVRAMDDPRLTILTRSPPGPGGYAARNLGVEAATGEWVAFLDADDLWRPEHLANLHRAIAACGEPVGCAFSRFMVCEKGRDREYPVAQDILKPDAANDLATVVRAWLVTRRCPLWTGAVAFRRDLLIEAGLFPAGRARRGGDKDLWLRCLARSPAAFAPQISAEFHQDTVNRVTTTTAHADIPIVCTSIADLVDDVDPESRRLLKALSNQEIALYVRYATKFRTSTSLKFARALYLPQGGRVLAEVLGYMALGFSLRVIDPKGRLSI